MNFPKVRACETKRFAPAISADALEEFPIMVCARDTIAMYDIFGIISAADPDDAEPDPDSDSESDPLLAPVRRRSTSENRSADISTLSARC